MGRATNDLGSDKYTGRARDEGVPVKHAQVFTVDAIKQMR